jgi:hypothetical protein
MDIHKNIAIDPLPVANVESLTMKVAAARALLSGVSL